RQRRSPRPIPPSETRRPTVGPAGQTGPVTRRGAVLFAAMAVIWGVPYLFIKVADRGLHPAVIVSGRTLIGALVLLPLAARAKAIRPVLPGWRWLIAFAVIEMAIP